MSPLVSERNNQSETENSNMSTEALSTNTATGLAFAAQDIDIPRLNVIQKMSEIEGPIGSVVIDKDSVLLEAEQKTYKRLFTFSTFNPDVPVSSRFWNFGTELMSKGKYSWYVPTLAATKDSVSTEVAEFAARLTKGGDQ